MKVLSLKLLTLLPVLVTIQLLGGLIFFADTKGDNSSYALNISGFDEYVITFKLINLSNYTHKFYKHQFAASKFNFIVTDYSGEVIAKKESFAFSDYLSSEKIILANNESYTFRHDLSMIYPKLKQRVKGCLILYWSALLKSEEESHSEFIGGAKLFNCKSTK